MVPTRRLFIFGAAAVVATARAGLASDLLETIVVPPSVIRPRFLWAMSAHAAAESQAAEIQLSRGVVRDNYVQELAPAILKSGIGPGGCFYWNAHPGREVVDVADGALILSVAIGGPFGAWDVDMCFRNLHQGTYVERHVFPRSRGPVQVLSMEV